MTRRVPLLVLLGVVAVLLRPAASTAWLWLLAVVLLVTLDWAIAAKPQQLELDRLPIEPVRLGGTARSTLVVTNHGGRPFKGLLRDAWQPSAGAVGNRTVLDLAAGAATRLVVPLTPTRRGDRRATQVTVRSLGPLGLMGRQRSTAVPGAVRSLPPFESQKHLPSRLALLRELDGRAAVRVRGQGTEFDSLREYVRGDDVRSIDWRATARNRNVVVRTWQPERDRRVVLVLDTSRTSVARVGDIPRLDSSMDAGLLLAALAQKAGDRVDFIAGDRRVRAQVRSGGRGGLLPEVMSTMADLEPALVEADWSQLAASVTSLGRQRSLVVLLTALDPAAVEHSLLPTLAVLTRMHRVTVAAVRDPALEEIGRKRSNAAEVYDAAAAEQVLADRARTADLLKLVGADVIDAEPDQLPLLLTDHYLALKARGLL